MKKKISQILADLFSQPKPGEDWNVRIQRFRDEIKKLAERDQTVFGQFLGILESFKTVIPDEKQRYHAAIQALSTTSKLSKDALVNAIGGQLAELAAIEKSAMPAVPAQRNELTNWDARAKALQSEIAQLRERVVQLENEEKTIATYIAARQQELEYVEKSMQQIFAAIGSDMTAIKNKVLEYTSENTAAQPTPQESSPPSPQPIAQAAAVPAEHKEAAGQQIEIPEPPLDPNLQKKCPMCGGIMNFHGLDDVWVCYTCAHEDSGKGGGPDKTHGRRSSPARPARSLTSNEHQEPQEQSSPSGPASTKKKACPVCRMNLLWYPDDKAWRCHSCNYERRI